MVVQPSLFVKMKSLLSQLVNTTKIKIIAFVLFVLTLQVVGYHFRGFITGLVPRDYTFTYSINVLIIVVFGGLGYPSGAIVSAIVLREF